MKSLFSHPDFRYEDHGDSTDGREQQKNHRHDEERIRQQFYELYRRLAGCGHGPEPCLFGKCPGHAGF